VKKAGVSRKKPLQVCCNQGFCFAYRDKHKKKFKEGEQPDPELFEVAVADCISEKVVYMDLQLQ